MGWFSKKPKVEESWHRGRSQVGNCPKCGAPVYEIFEIKGSIQQVCDPQEIKYTCDCKQAS